MIDGCLSVIDDLPGFAMDVHGKRWVNGNTVN